MLAHKITLCKPVTLTSDFKKAPSAKEGLHHLSFRNDFFFELK